MQDPRDASVLAVVDDSARRGIMASTLRGAGFRVIAAASAADGLQLAKHEHPDLVVLDLARPDPDGFEVCRRLKANPETKAIPVALVSPAFVNDLERIRGFESGADACVADPIDPSVLVALAKSRRRSAEQPLPGADEQQALLFERSPLPAWVSEKETLRFLAVNEAAIRHYGYSREEFLAMTLDDIRPPEDVAALRLRLRATIDEVPGPRRWRHRTKDGMIIDVEISRAPLVYAGQRGVLVVVNDVTARREAEEREQQAKAEAARAHRALEEFLAVVSHELRTPLNVMLNATHLLKRSVPIDDQTARRLETLERNTHLQAQLIGDLLDCARIVSGKLNLERQPVDLGSIVEQAVDVLRADADARRLHVDVRLVAGGAWVLGDPVRLQQVVCNLVSNAIKFTPSGGLIWIWLGLEGAAAKVTVGDTGCGISPDFLPQVFDRFRQLDPTTTRRQGGLGLGLAIVRELVELHGGSVHAESPGEGRGATFTVTLPIAEEAPAHEKTVADGAASATPSPGTSLDLAGVRVLVVEDDDDTRSVIAEVLSDYGAAVTTAPSVGQGLLGLKRFRPHVLVADIAMPDEDGYALIRRVRAWPAEEGGQVAALALTAHARREDRERALFEGFQMHLAKPMKPDDLVRAVATLARREARPAAS